MKFNLKPSKRKAKDKKGESITPEAPHSAKATSDSPSSLKKQEWKRKADKVTDILIRFGARVGNQKHLSAIRDSFAIIMPLIIIGSMAVLINNVFLASFSLVGQAAINNASPGAAAFFAFSDKYITPIGVAIWSGSLMILSLLFVAVFGYTLSRAYKIDAIMGMTVTVGAFFSWQPLTGGNYLGATGILPAIIVGILAPMIYYHLQKLKFLRLKMPRGVPPAVARAFSSLFPIMITIAVFAIFAGIYGAIMLAIATNLAGNGAIADNDAAQAVFLAGNIFYLFANVFGKVLATAAVNYGFVAIVLFFVAFFWFLGVHGSNVMAAVIETAWLPLLTANVAIFAAGGPTEGQSYHIWTRASIDIWANAGGVGMTFSLVVALLIFSRRKANRMISKVGLGPAVFNINEPILFGMPIVLNPLLGAPFVFIYVLSGSLGYLYSYLGWAEPTVATVPWTTPPVIFALLATGLGWKAMLLSALNIVIAFALWTPFVYVADKQSRLAEAEEMRLADEAQKETENQATPRGKRPDVVPA